MEKRFLNLGLLVILMKKRVWLRQVNRCSSFSSFTIYCRRFLAFSVLMPTESVLHYLAQGVMLVKKSLTKLGYCYGHSVVDSCLFLGFSFWGLRLRSWTFRFQFYPPLWCDLSGLTCHASPASKISTSLASPALNLLAAWEALSLQQATHFGSDSFLDWPARSAILASTHHSNFTAFCFLTLAETNDRNQWVLRCYSFSWAVQLVPPTLRFDSFWFRGLLHRNFCL